MARGNKVTDAHKRRLIQAVDKGESITKLAKKLGISPATAYTHINRIKGDGWRHDPQVIADRAAARLPSRHPNQKISESGKERLIKAAESGDSVPELAAALGVANCTAYAYINRVKGADWRAKALMEAEDQALKLRCEGYSNQQIAEKLDIGRSTASRYINNAIERRRYAMQNDAAGKVMSLDQEFSVVSAVSFSEETIKRSLAIGAAMFWAAVNADGCRDTSKDVLNALRGAIWTAWGLDDLSVEHVCLGAINAAKDCAPTLLVGAAQREVLMIADMLTRARVGSTTTCFEAYTVQRHDGFIYVVHLKPSKLDRDPHRHFLWGQIFEGATETIHATLMESDVKCCPVIYK